MWTICFSVQYFNDACDIKESVNSKDIWRVENIPKIKFDAYKPKNIEKIPNLKIDEIKPNNVENIPN